MFKKSRFVVSFVIILSVFSQIVFASKGFGVKSNSLAGQYVSLARQKKSLYITPDLAFEQVHFWYADALKDVEKNQLAPVLKNLVKMLAEVTEKASNLESDKNTKGILDSNFEYLQVAKSLFETGKMRDLSAEDGNVNSEIKLINQASGLSLSPVMKYQEDYTQYTPRGHYAQDAELSAYFKVLMWLSRIGFYTEPNSAAQIDENLAKKLTAQGLSLTLMIEKNRKIRQEFEKIENAFRLWIGESDDLTISEVSAVLEKRFGKVENITYSQVIAQSETIRQELNQTARRPQISSGINQAGNRPQLSIRFLGQRFMFDSFVFNQLTFGQVKDYSGNKNDVWTMSVTPQGRKVRGVPTVFDLMAAYNSDASYSMAKYLGDTDYQGYDESLNKLKQSIDVKENLNFVQLYHSAIRATLKTKDEKTNKNLSPRLEKVPASEMFALNSSIGAYILLRHDLVAYAKQSYTAVPRGFYDNGLTKKIEPTLMVADFPETFRILALAVETLQKTISAEQTKSKDTADELIKTLRLFEKNAGNGILKSKDSSPIWSQIEKWAENSHKIMVVTDAHTDLISGQVMQIGVGYPNTIVFDKNSLGQELVGVVFQSYEFKQPMDKRMLDEKWVEILNDSKQKDFLNFSGIQLISEMKTR